MPEHPDLVRLRAEYAKRDRGAAPGSPSDPVAGFNRRQRGLAVMKCLGRGGFLPLSGRRIFELGCGSGGILLEFLEFGAAAGKVSGADLLLNRAVKAYHNLPAVSIVCADGQNLPYPQDGFDLCLQFTVFSSVLDGGVRTNMARELLRVLRPHGLLLWYDFWLNPVNPQTRGIRPPEVRRLFPGCTCRFERVTLAPPLARTLATRSWGLCTFLEGLKVFNTHYLATVRQNA